MTKILVIEDNDGVREELVDILRFEGYDVLDAENGRIGLALVREWTPDLVVCDLMMPELDGYGTLEALRADVTTATLPFLCLTARGEQLDMQKAAALGADGYLTKPFTTEELLDALGEVASKRGRTLEKSVA